MDCLGIWLTRRQLGNSRYHDQTAGVTGVAALVADRHAHVKDAQGVDEAGSEAQDVLDQVKGEVVTSKVCGYAMFCPRASSPWTIATTKCRGSLLTKMKTTCKQTSGL